MKKIFFIIMLQMFCIKLALACPGSSTNSPEDVLTKLGINLKAPKTPVANYVNAVHTGNFIYLSGKGPELPEGGMIKGKVGVGMSIEDAKKAARLTAINLIGVLKSELKDLCKVKKIVKLTGMVNSSSTFQNHPEVINGASDLLVEVFGEKVGKHARVAMGANSLPFNIPVEIDLIVEIQK